ncbi:MAG: MBL fold metallo-hydrolase [Terricaulis sp.]
MADLFEIDFLDVETSKSGDAIAIRYEVSGNTYIHVVDAGFQSTGDAMVKHINAHYGAPTVIHNVVSTHSDGDHAGGLRTVLETFEVEALWILRPWLYADVLIPYFTRFTSVENLKVRLREIYPNLVALEEIAIRKNIPMYEPFQGAKIGHFIVMAPSYERYLNLIIESDKTPESTSQPAQNALGEAVRSAVAKAINLIRSAWGDEVFSTQETSAENEMSVVQFARIDGQTILLTADAGREALAEAADYAPTVGLTLPGIDKFQVPHHGSRRNVSTEILDRLLGERLPSPPSSTTFTAMISSAKADEAHPRRAVVRAMSHRGAFVACTEGKSFRTSHNAPDRPGWTTMTPMPYPDDQEE